MNVIQSIDAYIVRELGLRCNYNEHYLRRALRIINELSVRKEQFTGAVSIVRAYDLSTQSLLNYSNAELYALKELITNLLSNPHFEQLSVHDKYFCHANYVDIMRNYIRDIYAELAESNIMESILLELGITYTKTPTNLGELIRKSEYIAS